MLAAIRNIGARSNIALRSARYNLETSASITTITSQSLKMETKETPVVDYSSWTQEALIARIGELESSLKPSSSDTNTNLNILPQPVLKPTDFDFSRYSTRLIALKFAYIGGPYQGLEYHTGCPTALPTVEEKLFEALLKSRLVPPRTYYYPDGTVDTTQVFRGGGGDSLPGGIGKWIDLERWQYTKCGRTDRGVSAFGQVVGVRVRSNRPRPKREEIPEENVSLKENDESAEDSESVTTPSEEEPIEFDEKDELPYITILNRLLPPTIRVLAWCPNPPEDFSARFNCKARTYHYFFTNPASPPAPGALPQLLDTDAMRTAAKYYEGLHDFRNVCKIDASKQITNFKRRVDEADIVKIGGVLPVFSLNSWQNDSNQDMLKHRPEMYYFKLTGSAFLWHQVRHMIALLFLVGQGLEQPEMVKDLLDIEKVPTRPLYTMADDRPLVLWDCIFDENEVKWEYPELGRAKQNSREDVVGGMWEQWHNSNMDALLSGGLLAIVYEQQLAAGSTSGSKAEEKETLKKKPRESAWIVDGSPMQSSFGKYIPMLKRGRMESVEVINRRYAARKSEEWRQKWSVAAKRERGIGDMTDYDE